MLESTKQGKGFLQPSLSRIFSQLEKKSKIFSVKSKNYTVSSDLHSVVHLRFCDDNFTLIFSLRLKDQKFKLKKFKNLGNL